MELEVIPMGTVEILVLVTTMIRLMEPPRPAVVRLYSPWEWLSAMVVMFLL